MLTIDELIRLAGALGITPAEVQARFDGAATTAQIEALTTVSDPDLPAEVHALAMLCEVATGQRITAIRRGGERTVLDPARWRPSWERRPDEEVATIMSRGYHLIVDAPHANPIIVEGWLQALGYLAAADNPASCWVSAERRDEWRQEVGR